MRTDASVIVALIAAAVAVVGSILSFLSSRRSLAHGELRELRQRLEASEQRNIRLWAYCRKLIDHIYRGHGPPPPVPDDLDDLFGPSDV